MATNTVKLLGMLSVLLATTGCLQKDMTETWYVEPDGQVQWVVQETDVRSDAQSVLDRQREEDVYSATVKLQDHPIARGFRQLGFTDVHTRVLRPSVPFVVVTDAKAGRLDVVGRRIIAGVGLEGTSVLERTGDYWQWTMTVRDPRGGESKEPGDDVGALIDGLGSLHVVLAAGHFEDTSGFALSNDRRVASMQDLEKQISNHEDDSPLIVLRLKWQ